MANLFFHPLITLLSWCLMRLALLVVARFLSVLGGSKYSGHSLGVSSHYSKGIAAGSDGCCTVGPFLEAQ